MLPKIPVDGIITFVLGLKSDLTPEILKIPTVRYVTYRSLPLTHRRIFLDSDIIILSGIEVDPERVELAKSMLAQNGIPAEKVFVFDSKPKIIAWLSPRGLRTPPQRKEGRPLSRPQPVSIRELLAEIAALNATLQALRSSNLMLYKKVVDLEKQAKQQEITT